MEKINRDYETLTSKQRVRKVFSREKPDRVPINYQSNPGVDKKLKKLLGLKEDDNKGLSDYLGVDFKGIGAGYIGKPLHESTKENRYVDPLYGYVLRWVENQSGGYMDYCDFPLEFADEEQVAAWKLPNPKDYNYESLIEQIKVNKDYALHLGGAGLGCIMNTAGFFRGMEQTFVDLISDEPAGLLLIDRFIDQQFAVLENELWTIEKYAKSIQSTVKDVIEFVFMGEDLGTQHTPLISKDIFTKHIISRQKKFFDLCNSYGLPTLFHTCGSSSWAYEDYIKIGLTGVDTLQPEATNMNPGYLKKNFSGRLIFHGCISTGGPLAFGNKKETIDYCENTLDIMMPNYEYCFSPTHSLQDNTPPTKYNFSLLHRSYQGKIQIKN